MRKSFKYSYSEKKHTIVEFDVLHDSDGKPIIKNITMKSNFRDHLYETPELCYDEQHKELVFCQSPNHSYINGDLRQIITRMIQIAEESF